MVLINLTLSEKAKNGNDSLSSTLAHLANQMAEFICQQYLDAHSELCQKASKKELFAKTVND